MRAPYAQLYLHCAWATWDCLPLITPDVEGPIYTPIPPKCKALKCEVLARGGVPDHVHILVRLLASVSVATLLKGIKGS